MKIGVEDVLDRHRAILGVLPFMRSSNPEPTIPEWAACQKRAIEKDERLAKWAEAKSPFIPVSAKTEIGQDEKDDDHEANDINNGIHDVFLVEIGASL
ncbi:MAG: hypothetical protein WB542_06595 [Polaromonas sp.]